MSINRLFELWKEAVLQEPGILFQALSYKRGQASLFCSLQVPTN